VVRVTYLLGVEFLDFVGLTPSSEVLINVNNKASNYKENDTYELHVGCYTE
jgi:hypothetical protein